MNPCITTARCMGCAMCYEQERSVIKCRWFWGWKRCVDEYNHRDSFHVTYKSASNSYPAITKRLDVEKRKKKKLNKIKTPTLAPLSDFIDLFTSLNISTSWCTLYDSILLPKKDYNSRLILPKFCHSASLWVHKEKNFNAISLFYFPRTKHKKRDRSLQNSYI